MMATLARTRSAPGVGAVRGRVCLARRKKKREKEHALKGSHLEIALTNLQDATCEVR